VHARACLRLPIMRCCCGCGCSTEGAGPRLRSWIRAFATILPTACARCLRLGWMDAIYRWDTAGPGLRSGAYTLQLSTRHARMRRGTPHVMVCEGAPRAGLGLGAYGEVSATVGQRISVAPRASRWSALPYTARTPPSYTPRRHGPLPTAGLSMRPAAGRRGTVPTAARFGRRWLGWSDGQRIERAGSD
jgi:hypothetical protein